MSKYRLDQLFPTARRQGGVVSAPQARALGMTDAAQRSALRRGDLTRLFRALVIPHLVSSHDIRDAWALTHSAGPNAVVSGLTAARIGGLDIPTTQHCHVVVAGRHDHPRISGVRIMRRIHRGSLRDQGGIVMASRDDALLDTLIAMAYADARDLLDRALQLHWVEPERFAHLVERRARVSVLGIGRLRTLGRGIADGSRSEAERLAWTCARSSGMGTWVGNLAVRDRRGLVVAELDIADESRMIALEIDGRAHHTDRAAFESDRLRQNMLVLLGWTVLRFTWEQLSGDPAAVVRVIREAVALRDSA